MQKTRRYGVVAFVCLALAIGFLFVSCKEASMNTGELEIQFPDAQDKSILPGSALRSVNAIQISGTGPSGVTLGPQSFRLGGKIAISGLTAGEWEINVTGYNGTEAALGTQLTATNTQSVNIVSGVTTSATFNLHYLKAGDGFATVGVTWPSANSSIASVTGTVRTGTETEPTVTDPSPASGSATLDFSTGIKVGNYDFDLLLTNKSGTTISLDMIDMMSIFDDLTSTGSIILDAADVPLAATPVITASVQPTLQQEGENYRTVTISSATPNATIYYYLLDATESGEFNFANKIKYTGPFDIIADNVDSITQYVRATAVKEGLQDSVPASSEVKVIGAGGTGIDVTKPTLISNINITRENETSTDPAFAVTYSIQGNLAISNFTWYVDGAVATDKVEDNDGNTFTYNGTLAAGQHQVMVKLGYTDGEGATETESGSLRFTVTSAIATPVIETEETTGGQLVTIGCPTIGASIYYTTDGSTVPTSASTLYSSPFVATETMTIKAIAVMAGATDSAVATSGVITVAAVATPTFSADTGAAQNVVITCTDADAIYYTLDGTVPTSSSTLYNNDNPISVKETKTLKAIAVASGKANSPVGTAAYTITYAVGNTGPAGGIIFYVNTNAANDGWTYLEAASAEAAPAVWATKDGAVVTIGDTEKTIGTGKVNTSLMAKKTDAGAAVICTDKSFGGYDDWFLPSVAELQAMNDLTAGTYWSSSEASTTNAWTVNDAAVATSGAKTQSYMVRAVRSFL